MLAQQSVRPGRTFRGNFDPKMADLFWVNASASTAELAQRDQGAWRHCLVWLITVHQLRALPADTSTLDICQAGTWHILVRAPRAQAGSGRMAFAPLATDFDETMALVLNYQGPVITACMTLRSSGSVSGGPVSFAVRRTAGQ